MLKREMSLFQIRLRLTSDLMIGESFAFGLSREEAIAILKLHKPHILIDTVK